MFLEAICSNLESLPTDTDQDEDEMGHALDINHEQMHSKSINRGQEESVMEVANLSGQILFVGGNHLSIIEEEIVLECDISSTILKKIRF